MTSQQTANPVSFSYLSHSTSRSPAKQPYNAKNPFSLFLFLLRIGKKMVRTTNFLHLLLTLSLAFYLLPPVAPADANSDKAVLQNLRAALHGRWNLTGTDHCKWQGVRCDSGNRVIELHLPGVGFIGAIPSGVIGNLTSLNFLSLRFNALIGTIPPDFANCAQLKYLYLQGNRLSGDIPTVIFRLPKLFRLNLAGNNFSGEIPLAFNNLTSLATLFLEENQLTGQIPDLNLPNLKQFNVSHNLLTGTIPSQLCTMPENSFEGNSLSSCPEKTPSSSDDGGNKKKKLSAGAIAGIVIACVVALLAILLLIFLCCCRRERKSDPTTRSVDTTAAVGAVAKQPDVDVAGEAAAGNPVAARKVDKKLVFFGNAARIFDLDDLLRASAEVLGKGSYGTTYKASLENGVAVAVKRLKDVTATEEEFVEKMEENGRLEHENLVALRAYHCSPNEKLLVYDYFPRGSLSALLHGNRGNGRTPLNWETRSNIALGAARGIAYIHSQNPTSSHGNIKSSNILLSNTYEARVSDFDLSHLATPSATPNRVAGYRAPEITDPRRVSQKADVYSFGIFLLELLTGKAPTHALLNEQGVDLPRWVQSVVREEWATEVFDMELLRYQNVEEDMVQLLQLAIDCTAQYPDSRPLMTDVTARIEDICSNSSRPSQELLGDITSDPENSSSKPS